MPYSNNFSMNQPRTHNYTRLCGLATKVNTYAESHPSKTKNISSPMNSGAWPLSPMRRIYSTISFPFDGLLPIHVCIDIFLSICCFNRNITSFPDAPPPSPSDYKDGPGYVANRLDDHFILATNIHHLAISKSHHIDAKQDRLRKCSKEYRN